MGVHLTFVRSCDLDEWTQSQIDAMRLGGNGNARSYFRKHGFTDLHGGKTEKKYKSKAAVSYKSELQKIVQGEAVKRGGDGDTAGAGAGTTVTGGKKSLLDNLNLVDEQNLQQEAKMKLEAATKMNNSTASSGGVLQPTAKLASSMMGASKLLVKPKATTTKTSNVGMLRKPTSSLKKTMGGSKLRINKLSMKLPVNSVGGNAGVGSMDGDGSNDNDMFEDIEETQKNVKEAEVKEKQMKHDAALAKALQDELK